MKLLFIRHAQSTGNQERRMQGHGDFALSASGKIQAEKLAQRLLSESWWPTHIYSSPLKRAVQTTEILVNHFLTAPLPASVSDLIDSADIAPNEPSTAKTQPKPMTVAYDAALAEFQNGIFQGLTWVEAKKRYPELCQELEASLDWIQIPEAESLQMARDRARQFIQALVNQHSDTDQIWIMTHSWILQHLVAELLGCDRSWRLHARNTALFEFWLSQSHWYRSDQNRFNTDLWQIRRFNDCRHLVP
ncbi:MAG: histidine phosphatase family protein [Leptolyngbyaceae bacterium]|nr:histidine phosphatase family protein [Leptolyngbyaceae bacterium]